MHASVLSIGINDPARLFLSGAGFQVFGVKAESADAVCDLVFETTPEAVVFGPETPHGSDAVARMRRRRVMVPIIRIESGPRNYDWTQRCIDFLDAGGDEVLEGPSRPEVLAATLRAKIGRARLKETVVFRFGLGDDWLQINTRSKCVLLNDVPLQLTAMEMRLLIFLAQMHGVVSRSTIDEHLYGMHNGPLHNCIEVFVTRIREKLGPLRPLLQTHRGRGYELIGQAA